MTPMPPVPRTSSMRQPASSVPGERSATTFHSDRPRRAAQHPRSDPTSERTAMSETAAQRIPTSLVGSYAQPEWLLDRDKLRARFPPRVRAKELWRVDPRYPPRAPDDAPRPATPPPERAPPP